MEQVRAARGPGKRRLATRGVAVAAILSLLAIGLGTGLANAEPENAKIHGIAEPGGRGEARPRRARDQEALDRAAGDACRRSTSTSRHRRPWRRSSIRTRRPPTPAPTTPPPPATPRRARHRRLGDARRSRIVATGDSGHGRRRRREPAVRERDPGACSPTSDQGLLPPDRRRAPRHERPVRRSRVRHDDGRRSVLNGRCTSSPSRVPRSWEADVNAHLTAGVSRHRERAPHRLARVLGLSQRLVRARTAST